MKKIFSFPCIVYITFILSSCVFDTAHTYATMKNISNKKIVVMFQQSDTIIDSRLFYGEKNIINPNSTKELKSVNSVFKKMSFFIFDYDSVAKSIQAQKLNGIVKKCLIGKFTISNDSLEKNRTLIFGK